MPNNLPDIRVFPIRSITLREHLQESPIPYSLPLLNTFEFVCKPNHMGYKDYTMVPSIAFGNCPGTKVFYGDFIEAEWSPFSERRKRTVSGS